MSRLVFVARLCTNMTKKIIINKFELSHNEAEVWSSRGQSRPDLAAASRS